MKKNYYYLENKKYLDKDFVIFGNGQFLKLILYFIKNDTPFYKNLKAFVAPKEFILDKKINQFDVIDEDNFYLNYSPQKTIIILAIENIKLNLIRKLIFEKYKNMGFEFFNYISSEAKVYSEIKSDAVLIFPFTIIQPNTKIGSNVIIRMNANISHDCNIEDHTFISNNVCTGGNVTIKEQCFIGIGSIIKDSLTIGKKNFIDAASYVHVSTKDNIILRGNPARYINI